MVDIPALRKVVDHALALPTFEEFPQGEAIWYQDEWLLAREPGADYDDDPGVCYITDNGVVTSTGKKCGTAACIAGWAVILLAPNKTEIDGEWLTLPDGTQSLIDSWAQERLGLTLDDADELFSASNEAQDIERITDYIIYNAETAR